MATIKEDTTIPAFEAHHLHRPSVLETWKRNVVVWFSEVTGCCRGLKEDLGDLELEEAFQREVSKQRFRPYLQKDALACVQAESEANLLVAIANDNGFDSLSPDDQVTLDLYRERPAGVYQETLVVRRRRARAARGLATASAATVAAVLTVVDTKIGLLLEDTDANHLLVDKVARQAMKAAGFRTHDVSLHIAQVVECYFQCRENQMLAGGTRRRVPAWVLNALGFRRATTRRKT